MRTVIHRAFSLALFLGLAMPARAPAQAPGTEAELRLRPGDAIRMEVKDEPDLRGDYTVDAEGYVLLPGIGQVGVTGLPFSEVRPQLLAAYAAELSEPVIQLTPLIRVAVLGQVRNPGLYMVDRTHTFSDVLALAGGLGERADPNRISLVRSGATVATVPEGGVGELDVHLRSGDHVIVGRQSWYRENTQILVGAAVSVTTAVLTSLIIR
ncbi:MAG TPA: polysaccharide biosynthesis/export family protein [Longimicrobiaceae bacterium]|nr:polysaccharide biosynthesis/export family protein [Longimicrobiaceae bacterium]